MRSAGHRRDEILNMTLGQMDGYLEAISRLDRESALLQMTATEVAGLGEEAQRMFLERIGF